jgi:hypothetical protein
MIMKHFNFSVRERVMLGLLLATIAIRPALATYIEALIGSYNSSPPTCTSGQNCQVQTDVNGNVKVNLAAGSTAVTQATASSLNATVVQATASNLNAEVVGAAASGATNAGNPIKIGCAYNSTAPTVTNGQAVDGQCDPNGNQKIVGNVAAGAADSGNGVKVSGVYNSSAPTLTSGNRGDAQLDVNGNLKVNVTNGIASGTAGSANAAVLSVQGISGMTPVSVTSAAAATGGATALASYRAAATPAAQTIKSSAGTLYSLTVMNVCATVYYLHLYTTSPTLGTTSDTYVYPIPSNSTSGAGFINPVPAVGASFTALYFAVTGGFGATDNTSITASCVVVNGSYL